MPAWSRPRSSVFGRRPTAASRWLPSSSSASAGRIDDDAHALAARALAHRRVLHAEVEGHAFALQDLLHLGRDLAVLAGDQAVAVLEHGHARAEAPVHLGELEADVAAADDQQVLGQEVDRHHRGVVEHRHVGDAFPGRQDRAAADVDEDLRRLQDRAVDLDRVRADEAGMAPDQAQVLRPADPLVEAFDRLADHRVLARLHRLHVDAHRPGIHPPVGGAPGDVGGAGARDQGLGRDAAVVDAGAAEVLALDERGLHARFGQAHRERRCGLAAADHDRVVGSAHRGTPRAVGRPGRDHRRR